jgi:serine/threonine protein kinase
MTHRIGHQLGNYRLIRLLGTGGFAAVYLGQHIHLNTSSAIKVLQTQMKQDEMQHFLREAQTIATLKHPHIIQVHDFGMENQVPFLVMDYAPHGTLRQAYPKGSKVALQKSSDYVKQVASALQYAHDHKVIHRDIKPENMLVASDQNILLSDFGIAIVTHSSRYQGTQEVGGTVAYMAPEQLMGKAIAASDQYALAIVVYEWLCGHPPFTGSFTEICSQHVLAPPPSLSHQLPGFPQSVEAVIFQALAKDPQQRYASVTQFAEALSRALPADQRSQPAPSSPSSISTAPMAAPWSAPTVAGAPSFSEPSGTPSPSPSAPTSKAPSPSAGSGPSIQQPSITPTLASSQPAGAPSFPPATPPSYPPSAVTPSYPQPGATPSYPPFTATRKAPPSFAGSGPSTQQPFPFPPGRGPQWRNGYLITIVALALIIVVLLGGVVVLLPRSTTPSLTTGTSPNGLPGSSDSSSAPTPTPTPNSTRTIQSNRVLTCKPSLMSNSSNCSESITVNTFVIDQVNNKLAMHFTIKNTYSNNLTYYLGISFQDPSGKKYAASGQAVNIMYGANLGWPINAGSSLTLEADFNFVPQPGTLYTLTCMVQQEGTLLDNYLDQITF